MTISIEILAIIHNTQLQVAQNDNDKNMANDSIIYIDILVHLYISSYYISKKRMKEY